MSNGYYRSLKFLSNYLEVDNNIYVTVSNIIMNKKNDDIKVSYLSSIFDDESKSDFIIEVFKSNYEILEDIYIFLLKHKCLHDFNGKFISKLMKINPNLAYSIVDAMFGKHSYNSEISFSFLWLEEEDFIFGVLEYTINNYCKYNDSSSIEKLFHIDTKNKTDNLVMKQSNIINRYISVHHNKQDYMTTMFYLIATFGIDRRIDYINYFININSSIDSFKHIPIEKRSQSWSGSEVPIIYKKIDFLTQLNKSITGIDYLEHKAHLDKIINGLKNSISKIKIREFLRDY